MNLIEHVWAAKAGKMPDLELPRTHAAVVVAALEAWEQLRLVPGQAFTDEFVSFMPKHLNVVLGADRGCNQ